MQDIRLVDNDGEYLNLETQDGDKYRLVMDDSLRAAVKRDSSALLDTVSISPREIQDAVRAGATSEEVASKHSVPLDYVEKFALTVIDEIGHIIASAQSVRIAVEQDRYSEATQLQFREILDERLNSRKAKNVAWSASKQELEPWHVSFSFDSEEGHSVAIWSFDQRKLVLSPENETAIAFSTGNFASTQPSAKLRRVEENIVDLAPESTAIQGVKSEEITPPVTPVATVSSIEELTRASVQAVVEPEHQELAPEAPLSPTADLLDALRKKRAETQKSAPAAPEPNSDNGSDSEQHESSISRTLPEDVPNASEVDESVDPKEEVAAQPIASPAKKGRPSMPSWDEIVFGTKTDD